MKRLLIFFVIMMNSFPLCACADSPDTNKTAIPLAGSSLLLVDYDSWNPKAVNQVTNPNPKDHVHFTSALKSPGLYWADSFRPYGDKKKQNLYYGRRRHGGSGRETHNPRLSYDPVEQATKNLFLKGEKGMPHTYQTRIKWPSLGPKGTGADVRAELATVQWEYKMSKNGILGGKQFMIATTRSQLHFEHKMMFGHGKTGRDVWGRTPGARVYSTQIVGGRGLEGLLCDGSADKNSPEYCAGIFRCPPQPALPHQNPKKYASDDHVVYDQNGNLISGDAYLVSHRSGWVRTTVTFDWRDPENHKVWMWVSDENTRPTLVIGLNGDGFPVKFMDGKTPIKEFWLEFNNSSTINHTDSYVFVRNLLVFKDAFIVTPDQN